VPSTRIEPTVSGATRSLPPLRAAAGSRAIALQAEISALRGSLYAEARRSALLDALSRLAELDPALAMQLAAALDEAEGQREAFHECLPHWLAKDAEAARSWLLSNVQDFPAETAEALARDAAESDPALGLAVAEQIYVGTRAPAMRAVFGAWAVRDPSGAAQAVERLAKVDGYLPALEEIGRLWGERDAPAAYAWASRLEQAAARRTALVPLLNAWADQDPAAAAQAVAKLPPELWRARMIDDVAVRWATRDAPAALAWVKQLEDPAARAAGATSVLSELLTTQPELAASTATELGEPVFDKLMTTWLARDHSAANSWLASHGEARPHE
jgi:hypothetical protein